MLIAGSPSQVAAALAGAEPYKQALQERGVLVVPLPFMPEPSTSSGGGDAAAAEAAAASLAAPGKEDLRWRATPIRMDDWRRWFEQQAGMAGKTLERGLYVSLRLDGRVRGSGVGSPPWCAPQLGWRQGVRWLPGLLAWLLLAAAACAGSREQGALCRDASKIEHACCPGAPAACRAMLAAQLPPTEGLFGGFLDGMDGRISSFD